MSSQVAITRIAEKNYRQALVRTFDLIGAQQLLHGKSRFLLKPNLCSAALPESGATTNVRLVEELVRLLREFNPQTIAVGESCVIGQDTAEVFNALGYRELAERCQLQLIDLKKEPTERVNVPGGRLISEIDRPRILSAFDFVINLPVVKTHLATGVSVALKNLKGMLTDRDKRRLHHDGLIQGVLDINRALPSHLVIVDGLVGQEGAAPFAGKPRELGLIISGTDPVAVDATCARIIGLAPEGLPLLRQAAEQGLGEIRETAIAIVGEAIAGVRKVFLPAEVSPGLIETINNLRLHEEKTCSGCTLETALALQDETIGALLRAYPGQIELLLGQARIESEKSGLAVRIGKCQEATALPGIFIPGCPPTAPRKIKKELRAILAPNERFNGPVSQLALERNGAYAGTAQLLKDGQRAGRTKVKLCAMTNLPDIELAYRHGANAFGLVSGAVRGQPSNRVLPFEARDLVAAAPAGISSVVLAFDQDAAGLIKLLRYIKPDAVQIQRAVSLDDLAELKQALPQLQIIKTLHVDAGYDQVRRQVDQYLKDEVVSALLFDTRIGDQLGGTGIPHDWSITRRIRDDVFPFKVILAGGLNAGNVAAALEAVRPYAVDVESGVRSVKGQKDPAKVAALLEGVSSEDRQ
jgi:uncharacterized protein (DUF362 family)/phosphoribosylanthranilate isomerase